MQPEKIGRYEIKSELVGGGSGTVYQAYDPRFEREVAVKVLPREPFHSHPQFKLRFEREAKIIAHLRHPSIVPIYDWSEDDSRPYFVMQYMSGGSLSDRIKAKVMPLDEAVEILAQLAPGIDEAHSKGIVHRDLKPSNILFDSKGIPYISDFRFAKFSQAQFGNMTDSAIIGTPAYMAPEQAQGTGVDGRADIYALGIILFEMLTGKQPYEADTPMGVVIKHITDPVPDILASNPNLPKDVETIIQITMAKDKEERIATAGDLVDLLRAVASGKKLSHEQTVVIKGAGPKPRIVTSEPPEVRAVVVATNASASAAKIAGYESASGAIIVGVKSNNNGVAIGENIKQAGDFLVKDKRPSTRRMLNAGFALPNNQILNRNQALSSNGFYDLLIDVGPTWTTDLNIVIKSEMAHFPEDKLPEDQQGYQVRIVFVSEDFSPHLSTAELWVPAKEGQSFPFVDGKRADKPGPVKLRVRAPRLGLFERQGRAHGRLCLYYKGQLIQSASVSVGVKQFWRGALKEPNKIEVDYVLAGNFEDSKKLSDREVDFGANEKQSVSVGLTLNDDGSGRHRILATYHLNSQEESSVPPAWTPYDSQAAQKTLVDFRKVMAECYTGLNDNFGKNRNQLGYDMLELAKLGDNLRTLALSGLDVSDSGKTVALWRRDFLNALKTGTVIQIARTGPANYVFPWALVYDIPLPEPDKSKLCKVIEEWNENGVRDKNAEMGCPYRDEDWHRENVICPYGFWGFKHIIEQPTGAIHKQDNRWVFDVTDKVSARSEIDFGVGITNDIDQTARDLHLNRLVSNMKARLNPQQPAQNRKGVLQMLRTPEIVYFLCHGEVDANQTPYLSIGERRNNPEHEIFPNTLEQWSMVVENGIDLDIWQIIRPLIFINGCHTTQLQPGVILNFVSAFADLGASGIIGTEVSVRADMAMAIGEAVLTRIGNGMQVGRAIREMRWEMLNRGNMLGLAYTPYSLANLHIERAD